MTRCLLFVVVVQVLGDLYASQSGSSSVPALPFGHVCDTHGECCHLSSHWLGDRLVTHEGLGVCVWVQQIGLCSPSMMTAILQNNLGMHTSRVRWYSLSLSPLVLSCHVRAAAICRSVQPETLRMLLSMIVARAEESDDARGGQIPALLGPLFAVVTCEGFVPENQVC